MKSLKKHYKPTYEEKKVNAYLSVPFSTNEFLRRATFSLAFKPIGYLVFSEKQKKKDLAVSI